MICADLALMADTERVARAVTGNTDRVDILINNAGGVTKALTITPEGNENTFASNHLGHFLLTRRLLPLLHTASASSPMGSVRIINMSSAAHHACNGLDWDDLQMIEHYVSGVAYCRVKLANLLFTRELASRLTTAGIVVHAMHPGIVDSNFINHGDDMMQSALRSKQDQWVTPQAAADALVWLATAEEPGNTSGEYFHDRVRVPTSAAAWDQAAAQRLWAESDRLVRQSLGS
jgi:NAD(P)-dependent dehydrogenase (short-subunit alcohol dehydrogenase family)